MEAGSGGMMRRAVDMQLPAARLANRAVPLNIHRYFHALVKAIGKVGSGDGKHQLLDLFDIEELAQGFKVRRLNGRRPGRELFSKLEGGALLFREDIAAGPSRFF